MIIDLWDDEDGIESIIVSNNNTEARGIITNTITAPKTDKNISITLSDSTINVFSKIILENLPDYSSLLNITASDDKVSGYYYYTMPLRPLNAFILRYMVKKYSVNINADEGKTLAEYANKMPMPKAKLAETGKHIELVVPSIKCYREILNSTNAYMLKSGAYRMDITRLLDLQALSDHMKSALPKISIDDSVKTLVSAPIIGFDGTMDSLKHISVGELNVVKANSQSYKATKKNQKTLLQKMEDFGIVTLYDLLQWLPKRYVDKSKPQNIRDLIVDEPATIIGKVSAIGSLPNNMGLLFTISTDNGDSIPVSFWRQQWLRAKFPVGTDVAITGKLTFFRGEVRLNGTSIENASEAAVMPIVPIYRQSESKGITTTFILSAIRELFSRLTDIKLPEYLYREGRMGYEEAYKELHLPTDMDYHNKVINTLAYYELIYMQIIMLLERETIGSKPGIVIEKSQGNYQEKAVKSLPFSLTNSQQKGLHKMNEKFADSRPSSVLLSADVGSGKTILAELSALRAVEAGYQAVILGPTDVLARQLFSTFDKIISNLNDSGENIRIAYLGGNMKVSEKKKILKEIKEGSIDIIVGTHSLVSSSVEYNNLGFICIDEQQKFGAEQRSKLLTSRVDGKVPDLLMMSATPIPRSTAQVFYGDIDIIILDEKPPGRLPIKTYWLEEDPNEIIDNTMHPMWMDVMAEATNGNQTFIITPLVNESDSIDAASAERTFKIISEQTLSNLNVGLVHGKMKADIQRQVMADFRDKKYDVLIASTIVEVGVDIPDATRVIVLSADRLGASSLHQIRGRAGRNSKPSVCYLISMGNTENSRARMNSLVQHENGFDIAKDDLLLRGEGKMFGSVQSGNSEMIFASIAKHSKWIPSAKEEALKILSSEYRDIAINDSFELFNHEERLV